MTQLHKFLCIALAALTSISWIHSAFAQAAAGPEPDLNSLDHAFGGLTMFFVASATLMILIGLLLLCFWVWMLIDCLKRNFNDKLAWIIVLVFLNILGAILYYFMVQRKNDAKRARVGVDM